MKGDWSGLMGDLTPLFDTGDKVINLIAHNGLDDTYPAVRVGRADADHDGNNIPTTYLKKSDAEKSYFALRGDTNNANWAILPGVYKTTPETTNAPGYGVLLVVGTSANGFTGGDWYFQIWFATSGGIQVRRSINNTSGGGWTGWETINKS